MFKIILVDIFDMVDTTVFDSLVIVDTVENIVV